MDKKIIFNQKAIIIPAAGDAVFTQILTETGAPGTPENASGVVEALIAHSETHVTGSGFSLEVAKTVIISGGPELPLQAGKIEVAHEVPAGIAAAFNTALQRGSLDTVAVDILRAKQTTSQPEKKAASGIILPPTLGILRQA